MVTEQTEITRTSVLREYQSQCKTESYGDINISQKLVVFINDLITETNIITSKEEFWSSFCSIVKTFTPKINELVKKRNIYYKGLDDCFKSDSSGMNQWISESGFIEEIKDIDNKCCIVKDRVDPEIRSIAGPQLVVPLTNARYSLNAVNSRWRSLYDALYGSNMFKDGEMKAQNCVDYVTGLLNEWIPIVDGTWSDSGDISIDGQELKIGDKVLKNQNNFIGTLSDNSNSFILIHNQLMIMILVDRNTPLGKLHPLGISDVILESSLTSIMDGEDSVAAVDEEDKMLLYNNWKGLMDGTLQSQFEKNGKVFNRKLNDDIEVNLKNGTVETLRGKALMLVRVVGLFINTDIVRIGDQLVPETIIDVILYSLISYWVEKSFKCGSSNSKSGSIYLVVPKLHGSEEVKLVVELFEAVEKLIGCTEIPFTLKIGIMDEEVRTSLNLENCLKQARNRVIFINTGFLDRTGDQIYTLNSRGPFTRKGDIKNTSWFKNYESRNVSIGLNFGLYGHAQIGKGMWAAPDDMQQMMNDKVSHVMSGANTAWVPSPTAACLHAIHYHNISVADVVENKMNPVTKTQECPSLSLLDPCVCSEEELTMWKKDLELEISKVNTLQQYMEQSYKIARDGDNGSDINPITLEVLNNVQCIVGYTSRWIILGIGCSKISNMQGVALMEDRATLRISSQHLANWLRHNVIDEQLVKAAIVCVVKEVDALNASEPGWYSMGDPMTDSATLSPACSAVIELCLRGGDYMSGYTEPILYKWRKAQKFEANKTN